MTHKLVDPLFPNHMSKYVDSHLVPTRTRTAINREEFEKIRSTSRNAWGECLSFQDNNQKQTPLRTSYTAHYSKRHLNQNEWIERSKSRPTSPTRRNNPHPPMPFMLWHLHNAPGFERKDDNDAVKQPYKVGYKAEKTVINQTKLFHGSAPDLNQNTQNIGRILESTLDEKSLPKAEAWLRQASTKDQKVILDMLKTCADSKYIDLKLGTVVKPEAKASLYRYLKKAGREEQDAMVRLLKTLSFDPYETGHVNRSLLDKQDPNRFALRRSVNNMPRPVRYETEEVVTRKFPYRTDFKIHPEWVP